MTTTPPAPSPAASRPCAEARAIAVTSAAFSTACSTHCHPSGWCTVVCAGGAPRDSSTCARGGGGALQCSATSTLPTPLTWTAAAAQVCSRMKSIS